MSTAEERLGQCLYIHFGSDAWDLARLYEICLPNECTRYADIDLPQDDKQECLLTAFEERTLLPVQTRPNPAWESSGLRFVPEESYFMPRVVRVLLKNARESGVLQPQRAVLEVLQACSAKDVPAMAAFFEKVKEYVRSFRCDAGLLFDVGQKMDPPVDVHASMDMYVLAGMMSPCTGVSVSSGVAWFEVNPSLFWTGSEGESKGIK